MKYQINGVEFENVGTHGCRWKATWPDNDAYENMMIDSACDQLWAKDQQIAKAMADHAAALRAAFARGAEAMRQQAAEQSYADAECRSDGTSHDCYGRIIALPLPEYRDG